MINMIFAHLDETFRLGWGQPIDVYDYFIVYYTNGKSKRVDGDLTLKEENFVKLSYLNGNMQRSYAGILYMHEPKRADTCDAERMRIRSIRERYYKSLIRHGWKITGKYIFNSEERLIIRKE